MGVDVKRVGMYRVDLATIKSLRAHCFSHESKYTRRSLCAVPGFAYPMLNAYRNTMGSALEQGGLPEVSKDRMPKGLIDTEALRFFMVSVLESQRVRIRREQY